MSAWSRARRRAARTGCRPQVRLDAFHDRDERRRAGAACAGRAARRRGPARRRPPGTGRAPRPRGLAAPTSASARARSSASSGAVAALGCRRAGRGRPCSGSAGVVGRAGPSPSTAQVNSSATSIRPHVAQRVANRSPIDTLRLRLATRRAPTCPGTRRRGGGRPAVAARPRRASGSAGVDSMETARRWRSTAARATQPPRPARSATTSPGPVWASMRAASRPRRGAGASRSKTGSGRRLRRAGRGHGPSSRRMLAHDGRPPGRAALRADRGSDLRTRRARPAPPRTPRPWSTPAAGRGRGPRSPRPPRRPRGPPRAPSPRGRGCPWCTGGGRSTWPRSGS